MNPRAHELLVAALAGAIVLSGSALPAAAHAAGERVEIIPFAGARFGGSFRDKLTGNRLEVDQSAAYGVALDIPWDPNTELELLYARQATRLSSATGAGGSPRLDLTIEYYQIGGTYLFEGSGRLQPYFAATVGATRFTPDRGYASDTRFSFSAGGGAKLPLTRNIGLRMDGRAYVTMIDSNGSVFCDIPGNCAIAFRGDSLVQWEGSLGLILAF